MREGVTVLLSSVAGLLLLVAACGPRPGEREYRQGVAALQAGDYVRALSMLDASVNRRPAHPDNARARNYLGQAYVQLGQLEKAMEAFSESQRLAPEWPAPTINLALLLLRAGDTERAGTLLREAALTDPKETRALEVLAALHSSRQRWDDARRTLREARERAPDSARILTALGLAEYHTGQFDESRRLWLTALEHDPGYAPALYNLGHIYALQPEHRADAAESLRQFLALAPTSAHQSGRARDLLERLEREDEAPAKPERPTDRPPAEQPAPEQTPAQLVAEAGAAARAGQHPRALGLYLQAAHLARRAGDLERVEAILRQARQDCHDLPRAHLALARHLEETERPAEAVRILEQTILLDPHSAQLHFMLGMAAVAAAEFDTALVSFRRAVEIDPRHADALWQLAELYELSMEQPRQSLAALELFLQRFPADGRVLEARRRVEALRREVPRVAPSTEEAPRTPASPPRSETPPDPLGLRPSTPRHPQAAIMAYNRGVEYQNRGEIEEAIAFYRRALEQDDSLAEAYLRLGLLYRLRGALDKALAAYNHALRLRPNHADARVHLGLILWEQGAYEDAGRQARSALEIDSGHAYGHYLLGLYYARDPTQRQRAAAYYRTFLRLAPNDPAAPSVRRWLTQAARE